MSLARENYVLQLALLNYSREISKESDGLINTEIHPRISNVPGHRLSFGKVLNYCFTATFFRLSTYHLSPMEPVLDWRVLRHEKTIQTWTTKT